MRTAQLHWRETSEKCLFSCTVCLTSVFLTCFLILITMYPPTYITLAIPRDNAKREYFQISVFWDVMLQWSSNSWHFKGPQCLLLQGLGPTVLDPEDGGTTIPWNIRTTHTMTQYHIALEPTENTTVKTSNLAFRILPAPWHPERPWHPSNQPVSQGLIPRR